MYKRQDETYAAVLEVVAPDDLVLFAAGFATKILIHRLWSVLRGRATLWDIGSAFDPYAGRATRNYHALASWRNTTKARNLEPGDLPL